MRIAVIALKNAADARMKTSTTIRLSHSSRSFKVMGFQFSVFSMKSEKGREKEISGALCSPFSDLYFAGAAAEFNGSPCRLFRSVIRAAIP